MRPWMYQCLSRRVMRQFKLVTFSCFLGFGLSACSGGDEQTQEPIEASEQGEATQASEDDGLGSEIADNQSEETAVPDDSAAVSDAEETAAVSDADGTSTEVPKEILDGTSTAQETAEESIDEDEDATAQVADAAEEAGLGTEAPALIDPQLDSGAPALPLAIAEPVPLPETTDLAAASMATDTAVQEEPAAPMVADKVSTNATASFAGADGFYVVQPGDSLAEISQKIYGDTSAWQDLAKDNHISSPYVIYPGNKLKFQTSSAAAQSFAEKYDQVPEKTVTVKKGDTLSKIAARVFGSASGWKIFTVYNNISNPHRIEVGLTLSYKDPRMMAEHLSTLKKDKKAAKKAH